MTMRFAVGDAVRVRQAKPDASARHIRTPHAFRGRIGRVALSVGAFQDPSLLAEGRSGAPVPLYRVRFAAAALFAQATAGDEVDVELYETWLEPAPPR
jgi:nitrile hydratase